MCAHVRLVLWFSLLISVMPSSAVGQDRIGSFHIVASNDPFDDSDRSSILNLGTDLERGTPSLAWKCMSDGLNVIVLIGGYMGGDSNDRVRVRHRFDSDPASGEEYWRLLSGNESAYIPMNQVKRFTSRAMTSDQVLIRITDPLDGENRTNTFELEGLRRALQTLPCARGLLGAGQSW